MKVCMIVLTDMTNDMRVLKEAKSLSDAGYHVCVLSLWVEGTEEFEKIFGFELIRVRLISLKWPKIKVIQFFKYIEFIIRCLFLGNKIKAKVYHSHDLNTLLIGYLLARFNRAKLVYDSHELWKDTTLLFRYPKIIIKLWNLLEKKLIKKADFVFAASDLYSEKIGEFYDVKSILPLNNCPSYTAPKRGDKIREELKIDNGKKIILYTGGIFEDRGLKNLILSMKYIEDALLVFLGGGYSKESFINLVDRLKLSDKIKFIGPVKPTEVLFYTVSADIGVAFVLDNCQSYYYSMPNKLFESIMARIPVVCSNLPGMKKVVEEFNIGKVFNPRDPIDIANTIKSILIDTKMYNKYKENTHKAALKYNWQNEEKKLLKIYQQLENN